MLKTRTAVAALLAIGAAACSSNQASTPVASTATAPQPAAQVAAGDVERTTFNPSLGVNLPEMTRRTSGLYVKDLAVGTGAVAASGRTVVVKYTGWLPNGKSVDDGEITVTLGTNKVIRAWEEGLLGMRTGGRRLLVVPPHLGYGSKGAGNDIPPNAVLVFVMQVQSVF